MSIDKTIEAINASAGNWLLFAARDDGTETRPFIPTDDLKALVAHVERLETALRNVRVCAANTCAKCCDTIDEVLDSKGKERE